MAENKDKAVEVEKKKPSRTKKSAENAVAETSVADSVVTSAATETAELKKTQRRSGKVTGIADVSAAMKSSAAEGGKQASTEQGARARIDDLGRARALGRRKESSARIIMSRGSGKIIVNGRSQEQYFARPVLRMIISQPFAVTERLGQYDVIVNVSGGGLSGQAGAVRHGLSRALTYLEPDLRPILKKLGFLTRDSRTVERKKYGQPKARRRFQFSKR